MSGITLAQAQAALNRWLAADAAVSNSQAYQMGDKQLTRANASEIRKNIDYWSKQVTVLSGKGSIRVRRVIFRDGL